MFRAGWSAAMLCWIAGALGATTPMVEPRSVEPQVNQTGTEDPIISHVRLTEAPIEDGRRTAEDILRDFAGLHSMGNYEGAALLATELIDSSPNHPEGYYNLACALARLRRTDQAFAALDESVNHGCRWIEHLHVDPDLDSLRGDGRFNLLLQKIEGLIAAEEPAIGPLRTDDWTVAANDLQAAAPGLLRRYHVPAATVALLDNGQVVWNQQFSAPGEPAQPGPPLNNSLVLLRRPVELLALIAASQQEQMGMLNLASLLSQADEIGLRKLSKRSAPDGPGRGMGGGHAARVSLATPATLQMSSPSARSVDWNGAETIPGTVELIALGIELTSDTSFAEYCENKIFEPSGTACSELKNMHRRRAASQVKSTTEDARKNCGPTDETGKKSIETPARMVGHSRLGTPTPTAAVPDGLLVRTTPADMALLIASLLDPQAAAMKSSLERMTAAARLTPGGLGLGIDINRTADGVRMQMAETVDGIGMLARWYPQTGRGVVIFFNSENGPDAAVRLAQIALGGS